MNRGLYSLFSDMMKRFIDRGGALARLPDLLAAQLLQGRELVADFGLCAGRLWQYNQPFMH